MFINKRSFILALAVTFTAKSSIAQTIQSEETSLQREIVHMVNVLGWPRMVDITLQRGDLQRAAASKLVNRSPEALQCVNQKFTQKRVLDVVTKGYERVYSDPAIVAEISRFYSLPGGQRIQDQVAARTPAVGASAAYEQSKDSHWSLLTPEEKRAFNEFANSPAGKAYVQGRPLQLKVHSQLLAALAAQIASECSQ